MRVAICDDDLTHSGQLETYLMTVMQKYINLTVDIEVYQSGEELLKLLREEQVYPQILFLDIEMGGIDGVQTAKAIRSKDRSMVIIYVTSYDKYTMDSFEVSPFRYLLKPITYEKIEQVFSAAIDEILNNHAYLFFKRNSEQIQIKCEDIVSIVSENGRMLRINTKDKTEENMFYAKIKDVEKQINPLMFLKINKGTIINLNYVHIITSEDVFLTTGERITISRGRKRAVKEAYSFYMKRRVGICP